MTLDVLQPENEVEVAEMESAFDFANAGHEQETEAEFPVSTALAVIALPFIAILFSVATNNLFIQELIVATVVIVLACIGKIISP